MPWHGQYSVVVNPTIWQINRFLGDQPHTYLSYFSPLSSQENSIRALSISICQCVKVVFDLKTIHDKNLKKKVVSLDMELKVINLLKEMNVTRKIRWIISVLNFKLTQVADF